MGSIQAIYSSPYPRALQTAKIIAQRAGKTVIEKKELAEFEIVELSLTALATRPYLVIWRPEHRGMEDGETVEEFFKRIGTFYEALCSQHANGRIVLVTHAGAIDAAFRWAIGVNPHEPWTFELEVPNASITEVEVWPAGRVMQGAPRHAVIYRIGDARHLGELVTGR
jgi:broad specificity phosphatase PhoE